MANMAKTFRTNSAAEITTSIADVEAKAAKNGRPVEKLDYTEFVTALASKEFAYKELFVTAVRSGPKKAPLLRKVMLAYVAVSRRDKPLLLKVIWQQRSKWFKSKGLRHSAKKK